MMNNVKTASRLQNRRKTGKNSVYFLYPALLYMFDYQHFNPFTLYPKQDTKVYPKQDTKKYCKELIIRVLKNTRIQKVYTKNTLKTAFKLH